MDKKRLRFKREEDYQKYKENENERNRVRMKLKYEESIKEGVCYRCSAPCLMNFKTGKPYHACIEHRMKELARQTKRRNTPRQEPLLD